jgi:hypothetical protein
MIITVNIPNTDTNQSLQSYAGLEFLPVKLGCGFICEPDCPECGTPFKYIAREGDVLYFQFRFPDFYDPATDVPVAGWYIDNLSGFWLTADLMNADGTVAIANITADSVGGANGIRAGFAVGFDGQSYQNLAINVNSALIGALNSECFFIRVNACGAVTDNEYIIAQGIGALPPFRNFRPGDLWIGLDNIVYTVTPTGWAAVAPQPDEGTIAWVVSMGMYLELVDGVWLLTSTSIGFVARDCRGVRSCDTPIFSLRTCQKLLCFESTPTQQYECGGKYFGDAGTSAWVQRDNVDEGDFLYKERFCIEGSIELVGFDVTRQTTSRGRVTEERSEAVYRLRAIVPESVAVRMKNAMLPQNFTINGLTFETFDPIVKDNDENQDWHIDIELRAKDCENVGGCI